MCSSKQSAKEEAEARMKEKEEQEHRGTNETRQQHSSRPVSHCGGRE